MRDVEGRRYLDCLAGYSALNFGHRHPVLVEAARAQLERVTLTSRAFLHDRLEAVRRGAGGLASEARRRRRAMDLVLPMNTGAEAVETAIKVSRKWGYDVKGVPAGQASIVVAAGNFHGRTTTIVSFSTDPVARDGFGPFTPGFRVVPYGDAAALEEAMDATTVAVLLEPIQGEAGVIVPPPGYLRAVRAACDRHGALFVADEIQSGLGRTGATFACQREQVAPDAYVLGKALGGGIVPVSAVVARSDVLGVLGAGTHGSTFGGNPLACAVGAAVSGCWRPVSSRPAPVSSAPGCTPGCRRWPTTACSRCAPPGCGPGWTSTRSWAPAGSSCERLAARGVLAKDTHGSTIRLAPPLVVEADELDWAADRFEAALDDLAARRGTHAG